MTTKEINTKNIGSINLPRSWKNGKAYVFASEDTIIIKKVLEPDFSYVRDKLRKLKGKISQKDINQAIKTARG